MTGVAASWRVSSDDLRLAGGILLFIAAREMIGQVGRPVSLPTPAVLSKHAAATPLAIPVIVTPWGATAILFFADLAHGDAKMLAVVIGILMLVMALNLVGMLLARQIVTRVGMTSFQVLGWIFAVLQAGLAVDAIVTSLRNLALLRPLS
jgi:small neutral amino acid transporter SnatA (MarC family)